MGNLKLHLKHAVAAVLIGFAGFLPQMAASQGLDTLLEQLRTAEPDSARTIANEIRLIWDRSGSASVDLLLRRGRDSFEAGDNIAAIEHFTAAVDHAPDFTQAWVDRARVYFEIDLLGPALGDLEQALALDPRHFEAIVGLAAILEFLNQPEDAYEAYLAAQAIHPHFPAISDGLERLGPLVAGQEL